ncbi:flagellar hook-associated protein 2 [Ornithinibacillus bavariensis]
MVMRVGGLASGINTDELIEKLMSAERLPLDRMQQSRTLLEWQRDGFREIYQKMYDMDTNMFLNMKMSSTYKPKFVSSSMENAVTATANSSASNGTYSIQVNKLATAAINSSESSIVKPGETFDPSKPLSEQKANLVNGDAFAPGDYEFYTWNEKGEKQTHKFSIAEGDSLNNVLKKISADGDVRALYDNTSGRIILESTKTGNNNTTTEFGGAEIGFDNTSNSFFTDVLGLKVDQEKGGEDAEFVYNGLTLTSKSNSYKLGEITFEFKNVTNGQNVNLTVSNDVDAAFDAIKNFVDKYNEIVEMINKTQTEERYRDYKPLTDLQKKGMEDREIQLWEEKAKSGILRGDSILSSGLFDMRQSWFSKIETGGEITSITQVGIKTSADYMNGGKLVIDEEKLKEALRNDPEGVYKLFSNNTEDKNDKSRGLINRLEDSIESTMKKIEERAGKTTSTLENYTLGKSIKDLNTRISDFEDRLLRIESRYWRQFSAMEQAIARLNNQSSQLLSQFGGGM